MWPTFKSFWQYFGLLTASFIGAESGCWPCNAVSKGWTCLLKNAYLGPKSKGLCVNMCEGTGQVKLVVLKNITLLWVLARLILHIAAPEIARQITRWQRLMMIFYVYVYTAAYSQQATNCMCTLQRTKLNGCHCILFLKTTARMNSVTDSTWLHHK